MIDFSLLKASTRILKVLRGGVLSFLLVLSLGGCSDSVDRGLEIDDAYFRLMPPGQSVSAAFMSLTNSGEEMLVLNGFSSPATSRVELHEHSHDNGMMKMRKVESLTISPGETVRLAPGGYHLMLFGLQQDLAKGDTIDIELQQDSGRRHTVVVAARELNRER